MENTKISKPTTVELNEIVDLYSKYDLSSNEREKENDRYINDLIKKHLERFSDKWFAEYSVIATTIDPRRENRLRCFSLINDNGSSDSSKQSFKEKIQTYITPIIAELKKKSGDNNWWFHNPETFLAPYQIQPYISFTNHALSVSDDDDLVKKIKERAKNNNDKYQQYDGSLYYSTMDYPRSFLDILRYSSCLYNSYKDEDPSIWIDKLVNHYHTGVEEARLYYDKFIAGDNETYCYLTFPIIASNARFITPELYERTYETGFLKNRFQGLGHCFIYFRINDISSLVLEELKQQIRLLFTEINNALHNFAFNYTFNIGLLLQEKSRKEAERSAKSAIMSRNMSHNLGSHVMAYLKQKMGSVASIMSADNNVLQYLDLSNGTRGDVELPFLVGLGRFIGYIQERQDYIATIATDYIPYGAPVNMKDAIYDELNPDLRYMRHKSDEKNRPMNILLSYIAKSEGLSRENMDQRDKKPDVNNPGVFVDNIDKFKTNHDILFGFVSYSKDSTGIHKEVFGLTPSKCNSDNPALDKMRGINFSLPGGLIGRQALFSVIENIIRNAAKHGDLQSLPNGNLCFTFDVLDCDKLDDNLSNHELDLESRICDPVWRRLYQTAPGKRMMYLLTITDNIDYSNNPEVAKKLIAGGLIEPYIDLSTGRMTESNKGIKEIRISSAWLRREPNEVLYERYPIQYLDSESVTDSVIGSINTPTTKRMPLVAVELTRDNHLRYIIALRKNRLVAVIADGLKDTDIFREIEFNSPIDWCVFDSADHFRRENQDNYRYIIVANNSVFNELRPFVSNRVLIWNECPKGRVIYNDISSLAERIKGTDDSSELQLLNKALRDKREGLKKVVLSHIYRTFTGLSEDGPTFFICDDAPSISEHIQYNKIKQVGEPTIIELDDINDAGQPVIVKKKVSDIAMYEYRTHHATKKDYESYWLKKNGLDKENPGKTYENIIAIDGITGDNSSDRLVRREPLNEEWYFSHLYAMQQKVAIFDERIFKIVHNVDETQFVTPSIPGLAQILDKLKKGTIDKDIALQRITRLAKGKIDTSVIPELSNDDIPTICSKLSKYNTSKFETISKHGNHLSKYYSERGVEVFSVIRDENGSFAIIGCVECRCNSISDLFECTFDRIATISWNKDSTGIEYNKEYIAQFQNKFDYISIHQGILDKIYEGFDIKEYKGGQNDVYKEKVTRAIHDNFMKKPDVIPVKIDNNEKEFLPRFIIHSGRSKPTKIDMPQHLPFVQYAALEHGVKDCKFSLIEVLDFAQFEGEA